MRQAVFPALVLAIGAFAVVGPSLHLARSLGLAASADESLVLLCAVTFFYAVLALLERALPHRAEWARAHEDVRTDTLHLLVTGPGAAAVFDGTVRGLAVTGGIWVAGRVGTPIWPVAWPLPLQLGLAIVVAELGHYWFHRVSHERDLLWRLHATHHSARRLYWLNATRFHPLDLFSLLMFQTTPLLLLGADRRALLSYALFSAVYGQIQHCNVDLRPGPLLDWLFSTPTIHRWHHSRDVREANHNYGAIVNVWDHAFGTYFRPRGRAFAGPVGIESLPAFPTGYASQLLAPFRWARVVGRRA